MRWRARPPYRLTSAERSPFITRPRKWARIGRARPGARKAAAAADDAKSALKYGISTVHALGVALLRGAAWWRRWIARPSSVHSDESIERIITHAQTYTWSEPLWRRHHGDARSAAATPSARPRWLVLLHRPAS